MHCNSMTFSVFQDEDELNAMLTELCENERNHELCDNSQVNSTNLHKSYVEVIENMNPNTFVTIETYEFTYDADVASISFARSDCDIEGTRTTSFNLI